MRAAAESANDGRVVRTPDAQENDQEGSEDRRGQTAAYRHPRHGEVTVLVTWQNTDEDWKRLEAAVVLLGERAPLQSARIDPLCAGKVGIARRP